MAARTVIICLGSRVAATQASATARRAMVVSPAQKYYHGSPNWRKDTPSQAKQAQSENPIAASMAKSASPSGNDTTDTDDRSKNAAFLGEADSDDGFEADVEINPEAHRHKLDDVNVSGLHGQAGEGDEPIERERKPQEAIDASQSAFLGESDSDDAYEADREINPEKYRHRIDDASQAAYLGESDSDDAHEADREINPEKYRHQIEDPSASGVHGESGQDDTRMDKQ